jgi:hypothetical protein
VVNSELETSRQKIAALEVALDANLESTVEEANRIDGIESHSEAQWQKISEFETGK